MNRNDLVDEALEARLRAALHGRATTLVPETRPAPRWREPKDRSGRYAGRVRPWLTPLAAAAAVLVVAGGIAGSQLLARSSSPQPAPATTGAPVGTASPTAIVAPPTASGTSASSSVSSPAANSASSASSPVTGTRHDLGGGVVLVIPAGWTVGSANNDGPNPVWCLTAPGASGCSALFTKAGDPQSPVDVELEGGFLSNPEYCDPADTTAKRTVKASGTLTFGGRPAEHRWWHWTCAQSSHDIDQYVVASPPGFVLFSERADQTVRTALAQIATASTLPAATPGALRLFDQGKVLSATRVPDGVDITLDRMTGTHVNDWTSAGLPPIRYHLPSSAQGWAFLPSDLTRQRIQVFTDGKSVTQVILPGG